MTVQARARCMFEAIDWYRPWLAPFLPVLRETIGLLANGEHRSDVSLDHWRDDFNAAAGRCAIENHRTLPLQFVDQAALPAGTAYEAFISDTGHVPTRRNLHDFFNALVWLAYPLAKAQLNALQAAELIRRQADDASPVGPGGRSTRGVVRDRATIFDENAAILVSADPAIESALQAHCWQDALVSRRAAFGVSCEVRLFGHALIEKLVAPYKAITAHVWVLRVNADYFSLPTRERSALVDCMLRERLKDGLLDTAPTPLPVLGVPGWWGTQDAAFYADASVFRLRRAHA